MKPQVLHYEAVRVLSAFDPATTESARMIAPLACGKQAGVVLVRRRDGRPVWQDRNEVVVKVYDTAQPQAPEAARDEWESLKRLSAILDGQSLDGWTIHSPRLLLASTSPLGAVMTVVPGRPLASLLARPTQFDARLVDSLTPVIVAALERYWAEGHLYGDLHLRNILCDPAAKALSFVDPGMPETHWGCPTVAMRWAPASRDLAYLLYYSASQVKATLNKPGLRRREKRFVARLLQQAVITLAAPCDRRSLVEEIRGCAYAHLERLETGCSARGAWRLVVKQIATRYVESVLATLPAAVELPDSSRRLAEEVRA